MRKGEKGPETKVKDVSVGWLILSDLGFALQVLRWFWTISMGWAGQDHYLATHSMDLTQAKVRNADFPTLFLLY